MISHQELLAMVRQRPFVPFRLVTTEGPRYEIRHPEMLMPGYAIAIVGIPDDPAVPAYDRTVTVALPNIERLEPITSPSTSGNGPT